MSDSYWFVEVTGLGGSARDFNKRTYEVLAANIGEACNLARESYETEMKQETINPFLKFVFQSLTAHEATGRSRLISRKGG